MVSLSNHEGGFTSPHPANPSSRSVSARNSHSRVNAAALPHVGAISGIFSGSGAVGTIVAIRR